MNTMRRVGIQLALVTATISGVSVYVNAHAVRAFADPTVYTTLKNTLAAVLLLTVVALAAPRGARIDRPTSKRDVALLAVVGLVGGSIPFVLFFEGLARADSAQAAFVHKTLVLWVAVLAVLFLGERLQWGHWLAIGALVVGQVGLAGGLPAGIGTPEMLILAATLLWAVEVAVAKRLLGHLSSWTVATARMTLGSAALIAWVAITGHLGALVTVSGEQLGWLLLTGALLTGYVATWFAALQRAHAVDVTAALVLAAPLTAAINALAGGPALAVDPLWLVLVVAAVAFVLVDAWRSPARSAAVGA